jgi:hypothetical protein
VAVSISRNFPPLDETVLVDKDDWGRIGRLARERIIRRTLEGKDEHGSPFQAYSDGYLKQREAAGKGSRVDLQLSGEMLRAITVEPDDDGVTLAFTT